MNAPRPVGFAHTKTGKIVIWGGVILVGSAISYLIIKKAVETFKEHRATKQKLKDVNYELNLTLQTQDLTHPESEYNSMVDKLKKSFEGCGTTDANVFAVFRKIKNNADFLKLKKSWGTQKWDGCNWAFDFGDEEGTLDEAITSEMDSGEISEINDILRGNGVTYTF